MIDYIDTNKKLVQILFNHSEPQLLEKNMVTYFTERYHTLESNKLNSYPFIYHIL